ncbi:MAG: PEGA domain-containing protein [Kofleriaceae bacterium]
MGGALASGAPEPAAPRKLDAIRIVTRCTDLEQFTAMFSRFCNPTSCFIPSLNMRPVGVETAFSIRLVDQTPVMRGIGVVLAAWPTSENPFGRPGIQLGIKRLSADSLEVFQLLVLPHTARGPRDTIPGELEPHPAPTEPMPPLALPPVTRTPGSSTVLPANPLTGINDDSLDAFVECQLQEVDEEDPGLGPGDLDFEGPLTIPNNDVIALAAAAATAVAQRPPRPTAIGVVALAPPKVYAAPELVVTELVDRVAAVAPPRTSFLRQWWLACSVVAILIGLVGIAAIATSRQAEPPAVEPTASSPSPPSLPSPPGRPATAAAAIQPTAPTEPAACKLTVTTHPEYAHVKIDDEPLGVAPITVTGPCTKRRVDVRSPRWATSSKWVEVADDTTVEVSLMRPKHALTVRSMPNGALIMLDGKRVGVTPAKIEVFGWTYVSLGADKIGFVPARKKYKSIRVKDELTFRLVKQ